MANDFGQLHANETKTTLFWGNMLNVTVCAKGNDANCKKHTQKPNKKTIMKTQRVSTEDGKCKLEIAKQKKK